MTQDRYLGRRLTDRQTGDALEAVWEVPRDGKSPKVSRRSSEAQVRSC